MLGHQFGGHGGLGAIGGAIAAKCAGRTYVRRSPPSLNGPLLVSGNGTMARGETFLLTIGL